MKGFIDSKAEVNIASAKASELPLPVRLDSAKEPIAESAIFFMSLYGLKVLKLTNCGFPFLSRPIGINVAYFSQGDPKDLLYASI